MTAILNIQIQQGATFTKTFEFRKTVSVREPVISGAASISCYPLTVDLPVGQVLIFGMESVTAAASVPAGGVVIPITSYNGMGILAGAFADIGAEDLTGLTWRAQVKKAYKDVQSLVEMSFEITPLTGVVVAKISATTTALLTPNAIYSDLPPDIDIVSADDIRSDVWAKSYFWDLEYEDSSGCVTRIINGRCWITFEATR
jgi:hypothetical protein